MFISKSRENMLYAIAKIQGKQYKLVEGKELAVDRLPDKVGQAVNVDEVLLVAQGDNRLVGAEANKAKIKAIVVEELRDKKILVLKYKKRKRYRKLTGHRQHLTLLKVEKIDFTGKKEEKQAVTKSTVQGLDSKEKKQGDKSKKDKASKGSQQATVKAEPKKQPSKTSKKIESSKTKEK